MAQYCELDDIRDVLSRDAAVSAEQQNNGSTLDEENLAAARADAQAEIDGKLTRKYTVPFSPVPVIIKMITVNIAAWLADLNYRENRDMESELNPVYQRYARAETLLGLLSTGEMVIPPDGDEPVPPDNGSGIRVAAAYSRAPLITECDFDLGGPPLYQDLRYWPEGWAIH